MNFLKRDLKEEWRISRRRQAEELRKPRIFDAKTRLIGVDVRGLDEQRQEKKILAEAIKRNEDAYTKKRLEDDKRCVQLEKQIEEQKRNLAKDIKLFQDQYQHPATRREFDLNDPNLKKKLNYKDDISFEGEDPNLNHRLKEQKRQNRAWLMQQIEEKRLTEQDLKTVTEEMERSQSAYYDRAVRLAALEEKCRKKIDEATAEFNKLSAQERAEINREEAEKQTKIEANEIENWVTGDFLTENPQNARSAFGPGRVIAMMYKGEPQEKEFETKKIQREQSHQHKARLQKEEKYQKSWENYHEALHKQAFDMEQAIAKEQRKLDGRIVQSNCLIAHQHAEKEAERNKISDLYPTHKFFDQFNRTTY